MTDEQDMSRLPIKFALHWGDFGVIALMFGGFTLFMNSIRDDVKGLEQDMDEVQMALARIENSVGSASPVAVSMLWVAFSPNNGVFSSYNVDQNVWTGAWPAFANAWAKAAGFPESQFVPNDFVQGSRSVYITQNVPYLAAVLSEGDPQARELRVDGWTQISLDTYLGPTAQGPFGYALLLSPQIARSGRLPELTEGLETIPTATWEEIVSLIEEGHSE